MLISVVVCAYNEAGNSLPLIAQIDAALADYTYEIIYVNDGSTDQTLAELRSLAHPRLTIIDLRKNYGQSAALAAGIDAAAGTLIVTMDGDQQNDPADIVSMIGAMEEAGADLVIGIRQQRQDHALLRKLPSRLANGLIRRVIGLDIADNGCALKLFRAETAKELHLHGELHRFIAVLAHIDGARLVQIPVRHHPRRIGQSKYGLGRTMRVISDLMWLAYWQRYGQKPMHLFGGLGLGIMLTGLLITTGSLVVPNDVSAGVLSLLTLSVWLIGGLQLLAVGIALQFQVRTHYTALGQKPYKIRGRY